MLESAKQYVEKTPDQIVEQYITNVELHGMHSDNAKAQLKKMIYAYGQTVANIVLAESQQHK